MFRKWLNKLGKKDTLLHGIVLLGILGMGCILLSSFFTADTEPEVQQAPEASAAAQEAYRQQMETELTAILGRMAGVGRVEVLVTVTGSEEYHYAKEGDSMVSDEQVKSSSSYVTVGGSAREALVESVTHPPIAGVVVACEGGDRSTVKEQVYHAVAVACGISTAQICVTKLN